MEESRAGSSSSSSSPSGYALGPPWLFRGRALYQLHLVKAEIVRAFIPKEFKLVEAFGYTLGGLFLAHYDESPAGVFDELVVLAGIVWNPPTSCAWASRVLVNSHEACRHGRKEIGLPSHVAIFSKKNRKALEQPLNKSQISSIHPKLEDDKEIQVHEMEDTSQISICNISLPIAGYSWMGPKIKISLPSFSGQTVYNPNLLKYSCQVECRVRAVEAAKISRLMIAKATITEPENSFDNFKAKEKKYGDRLATEDVGRDQSIEVLLSKPVMALEFNFLKMQVEAPIIIHSESRT
ncbi:protein NEOXANTHIN-DEFICIENT 1-like [Zingiber officinale]|uniref:protein NEOXANTHIN-DEFICIENT 1-like n=1 Tax=Zingiber officinale TaxID=94328 RepID=UPI001C4D9DEB|nr:protein NEOXANTHIN-DEFICIENT 1-like [Zingiber officinale]